MRVTFKNSAGPEFVENSQGFYLLKYGYAQNRGGHVQAEITREFMDYLTDRKRGANGIRAH